MRNQKNNILFCNCNFYHNKKQDYLLGRERREEKEWKRGEGVEGRKREKEGREGKREGREKSR